MGRAAQATIDLNAIRANYRLAKQTSGAEAVAIIKADAYGHGAVPVARALEPEVVAFGVACIEEARELRAGGITKPVLLLEGFFTPDEIPEIAEQGFWTALHRPEQVDMIAQAQVCAPLTVWLKMDSGMHRLGVLPEDYACTHRRLSALPQVAEVIMMSHLACADEPEKPQTLAQQACFESVTAGLAGRRSIANSAGILQWPVLHKDLVRPGLMLYGASPFEFAQTPADQLQTAMTLSSEVIAVRTVSEGESVGYGANFVCDKPTRVGTVAMGYADGYSRHGGTGTPVIVNGQRTRIIGRVSMDMCTVDLTGIDVEVGAAVEFWGKQLSINEVAAHCGTIPYTLFTGVTKRVPRVYKNA